MITTIVKQPKQHEPYRSRDEIVYEILTAAKSNEPKGVLRIKLLYSSHLSTWQLKNYLNELLTNGLLTVDSSKGFQVKKMTISSAFAKIMRWETFADIVLQFC